MSDHTERGGSGEAGGGGGGGGGSSDGERTGLPGWLVKTVGGAVVIAAFSGAVSAVKLSGAVEQLQVSLAASEVKRESAREAQTAQIDSLKSQVAALINLNSVVLELGRAGARRDDRLASLEVWQAVMVERERLRGGMIK